MRNFFGVKIIEICIFITFAAVAMYHGFNLYGSVEFLLARKAEINQDLFVSIKEDAAASAAILALMVITLIIMLGIKIWNLEKAVMFLHGKLLARDGQSVVKRSESDDCRD